MSIAPAALTALLRTGCGTPPAADPGPAPSPAPTQAELPTAPPTDPPTDPPTQAYMEPPDPETAPPAPETLPPPQTLPAEETDPSAQAETETLPPVVDAPDRPMELNIEPGIWIATGGPDGDRYFDFSSGTFLYQDSGTGLGFTVEMGEDPGHLLFHFGDTENNTPAAIYWDSAKSFVLEWKDGSTERLTWWRDETMADFTFYSNEKLCEMALGYYEMRTGYRPARAAAEMDENGAIAIQLYDDLGDHISTADWYTVDRFTATGEDLMGNAIDLKTAPLG